jgi:enoyl-CoA hydratase/carnithine racemase
MEYETLILKKEDHIATLIMNRPEVLNALNQTMYLELESALRDLYEDDEIRVMILTGAGRAFNSGSDFRFGDVRRGEITDVKVAEDQPRILSGIRRGKFSIGPLPLLIQRLDKPTIAMVKGDCIGVGVDIATACDLRIGTPQTRFSVGFTRMGLSPDQGQTWTLPRIIGVAKALEFIYTADPWSGDEAYRVGLLNKLVPPEDLEKETMALATKIASGPPIALRMAKLQVYEGLNMSYEAALGLAFACVNAAINSEDHLEGIKALAEKRLPEFQGR